MFGAISAAWHSRRVAVPGSQSSHWNATAPDAAASQRTGGECVDVYGFGGALDGTYQRRNMLVLATPLFMVQF